MTASNESGPRGAITALLGPTNTGKTHIALERLLEHPDGVIGFPLRLLAREAYDRLVSRVGVDQVALVTGEEKVVPRTARYFACTVEAMPQERNGNPFSFVGIDEVQLCGDPDRGHVFTDRLLHARGTAGTMVLGADTIAPLLRRLVPNLTVSTRGRFSTLSFSGERRIARLPKRSAVVAFSVADVYALAEEVRRHHGGAAVVTGALSPRTRNAQVQMFQAGEVDVLVATDAIGMGLNLDIDHIAFAAARKFDGADVRELTEAELAQIAGRAGRHVRDGTFGTTRNLRPFHADVIERIERHRFAPLGALYWRNTALDFSSLPELQASLRAPPPHPALTFGRVADDLRVLEILMPTSDVVTTARGPQRVRDFWEACQIPDFQKISPDEHARLVSEVWQGLLEGRGKLAEDWLQRHVASFDDTSGDVETLVARVAGIRTWTYITHKSDWVVAADEWQDRTRRIEDRLADALHDSLTHRFVDRLARAVVRGGDAPLALMEGGEVVVAGEKLGRLDGLRFTADVSAGDDRKDLKATAAQRALQATLLGRIERLLEAADDSFEVDFRAQCLRFEGEAVGRLVRGRSLLWPRVEPLLGHKDDGRFRERLRERMTRALRDGIRARLGSVVTLIDDDNLAGSARGVVHALAGNLGVTARRGVERDVGALDPAARKALFQRQVRLGFFDVFVPEALRPAALEARAALLGLWWQRALPPLPAAGRASFLVEESAGDPLWPALGFRVFGRRAFRIDLVDRAALLIKSYRPPFSSPASLCELLGCSHAELVAVLDFLGFVPEQGSEQSHEDDSPVRRYQRRRGPSSRAKAHDVDRGAS